MNTKRTLKWSLIGGAAACALVAAMPGCELLVDFDRSKIPSEAGTETDGTMPNPDAPASETGGQETSTDAPSEGSTRDAPGESAADAPAEASPMPEGGMDAPAEAEQETGPGPEAGPEAGPDGNDGATGAAVFTLAPAAVDYGTVGQGETTAAYTFTVTNTGTADGTPTINKAGTNPGDFTATGCGSTVAPNATCTLSVTFAPQGPGTRAATIDVGTGTPAALTGTGAANGTLNITPTSHDFGSVAMGFSSADFGLTVTNTDAVNAVTLGTPAIDGQDATMFAVSSDGGTGQCTGATLAPSATCTLFVHFSPSATGFRYASVSIGGSATDGGAAPGTVSASLTGTGQ